MTAPILSEFSRRAMATNFVMMIPGIFGKNTETAVSALAEVDRIESLLSVYRPDSDISRLNRAAGQSPVPISPDTFQVLQRATELSHLTGGAFDITAGPLVDAWGFTKRQGAKPSQEILLRAQKKVDFTKLVLNQEMGTAELRESEMTINLGAIGKGFALDFIAERLESAGLSNFLIHGGKSSVLVRGDDVPGSGQGWKIALEHPQIPGKRLGGLRLKNESIGTSGSGTQFFHHQGKRLGHVIDPRTGWPAGDLLSLTAVARSAMDADALATAMFVMGCAEAIAFAERLSATSNASQAFQEIPVLDDAMWRTGPLGVVAIVPTGRQAEVTVRRSGLRDDLWIDE